MDPLSAIGLGNSSPLYGLNASDSSSGVSAAADGSRNGSIQAVSGGDVGQINQVFSAVGDLLSSIGQGLENDPMLRTMLALMILSVLLQQQNSQTLMDLWSQLAGGNQPGSNGSQAQLLYASTTISVTQTVAYIGDASSLMQGGGQAPGSGLDLSI